MVRSMDRRMMTKKQHAKNENELELNNKTEADKRNKMLVQKQQLQ